MWGDFIKVDIFYGNNIIGSGTVYNLNGEDVCNFSCPAQDGYVYKLFLSLEGGGVMPMGIMLKNGCIFSLQKKVMLRKLSGAITYAYVEKKTIGSEKWGALSFAFDMFHAVTDATVFKDPVLQECALKYSDILYCEQDGMAYAAAPIKGDAPFSLSAFMCQITVITDARGVYGVLALDERGMPTFLKNEAK